ncbi:hypothetical protein PP4_42070 [Pseudomonas putida NBRC 14164]|uniref:Transposase n=1 Tax=Pseudomonas putida NBRC 14164 TaxID=1211579 RepID=A0ABM7EJS9_PSEPU|nr:hypothetical protein PP4_42070 [Pseudomonas putida NBRC 14164]
MADVFNFLQERIAMLLANGFAEQLTQHMDIFTQTHIDISHRPSLRRIPFRLHAIPVGAGMPVNTGAAGARHRVLILRGHARSHRHCICTEECPQPNANGKP